MRKLFVLKCIIVSIIMLKTFTSCKTKKEMTQTEMLCNTRYPIVLVHGISLRDDVKIFRYWGKIPKRLRKEGAKVFLGGQNAFGTHQSNAELLKKTVDSVLNETGAEKVNLIAHSKGGLEARYMISMLNMADKVASLTTLATPHRGSIHASLILAGLKKLKIEKLTFFLAGAYAKATGDEEPNIWGAANELTIEYMEKFNNEVIDAPQVYYQSWGCKITENYYNPYLRYKRKIQLQYEGENDGIVSLESCKWGNYCGTLDTLNSINGISHFDIVGITRLSDFNASNFLIEVVKDLKNRGF